MSRRARSVKNGSQADRLAPLAPRNPWGIASAGPCHRSLAAPPQRRRQNGGQGDHQRDGRHRGAGHRRCPSRGRQRPPWIASGRGVGSGKVAALVAELERTAALVERVAAQTRVRLAGDIPDGSTRVVSLHDPDARPIAKGRLGKPVEFGYKAQVVDNADGVVLDHTVVAGNPPDAPMLLPAITRIAARFGQPLRAVAADRGYGEAAVDAGLEALGVTRVAIPRKGRPGAARRAVQRAPGFVKLVKWRTGSEARVSHLNRDYGWARSRVDGIAATQSWCGWGVLAHTATKISALLQANNQPAPDRPSPPRSKIRGSGPSGTRRTTRAAATRCRSRRSLRRLPRRRGAPDLAVLAPLLCHPSGRGRLRPLLRAAAGRARHGCSPPEGGLRPPLQERTVRACSGWAAGPGVARRQMW